MSFGAFDCFDLNALIYNMGNTKKKKNNQKKSSV